MWFGDPITPLGGGHVYVLEVDTAGRTSPLLDILAKFAPIEYWEFLTPHVSGTF